uniref:Uncharacterized protein n=1 Tax=Globodera rostochiensis TaxID=31243 RepID=A0A914GR88_GLORO
MRPLMFLSILFAYKLRKACSTNRTSFTWVIVDSQSLLDEQWRKEYPGKAMADSGLKQVMLHGVGHG